MAFFIQGHSEILMMVNAVHNGIHHRRIKMNPLFQATFPQLRHIQLHTAEQVDDEVARHIFCLAALAPYALLERSVAAAARLSPGFTLNNRHTWLIIVA